MATKPTLHLVVREGGRKELERQLMRALIEFRTDDAHALISRIGYRASLRAVEVRTPASEPSDGGCASTSSE